jgi:hypothetical protein
VHVQVEVVYPEGSLRPASYEVIYQIGDADPQTQIIVNRK